MDVHEAVLVNTGVILSREVIVAVQPFVEEKVYDQLAPAGEVLVGNEASSYEYALSRTSSLERP